MSEFSKIIGERQENTTTTFMLAAISSQSRAMLSA